MGTSFWIAQCVTMRPFYFICLLFQIANGMPLEELTWGSPLSSPITKVRLHMSNDLHSGTWGQSLTICTNANNCCYVPIGDTSRGTSYDRAPSTCHRILVGVDTNLTVQVKSSDDNEFKADYVDIWTANRAKYRASWNDFVAQSTTVQLANLSEPPVTSPIDEEMVQKAFLNWDLDANGFLTNEEMKPHEDANDIMVREEDANGDHRVSYQEFFWHKREAFRLFDIDGNGYITKEELKLKLEWVGSDSSIIDGFIQQFIQADSNTDDQISFEEFVAPQSLELIS